MNANTTIFYDDTRDYDFYDNTRDYLYEMYADEYGWCDADDVPSQMVYTEIAQQNQLDWACFRQVPCRLGVKNEYGIEKQEKKICGR